MTQQKSTTPSDTSNTITDTSITPQFTTEHELSPFSPSESITPASVRTPTVGVSKASNKQLTHQLVHGPSIPKTSDVNAPTKSETLTQHIPSPGEDTSQKSNSEDEDDDEDLSKIKADTWGGWFILQGAKMLDWMDQVGGKVLGTVTYMDNPYEDVKYIVDKEKESLQDIGATGEMEVVMDEIRQETLEGEDQDEEDDTPQEKQQQERAQQKQAATMV